VCLDSRGVAGVEGRERQGEGCKGGGPEGEGISKLYRGMILHAAGTAAWVGIIESIAHDIYTRAEGVLCGSLTRLINYALLSSTKRLLYIAKVRANGKHHHGSVCQNRSSSMGFKSHMTISA
jgi:hypothetical protein